MIEFQLYHDSTCSTASFVCPLSASEFGFPIFDEPTSFEMLAKPSTRIVRIASTPSAPTIVFVEKKSRPTLFQSSSGMPDGPLHEAYRPTQSSSSSDDTAVA